MSFFNVNIECFWLSCTPFLLFRIIKIKRRIKCTLKGHIVNWLAINWPLIVIRRGTHTVDLYNVIEKVGHCLFFFSFFCSPHLVISGKVTALLISLYLLVCLFAHCATGSTLAITRSVHYE